MDSNQRFEQLKRKYAPVLDYMAEHEVQLQNLNVQDGKLLIRAAVASEDLKRRIEHRISSVNPSADDVLADLRVGASGNVPHTGQTQVQTSQDFSKNQHTYTVVARDSLPDIARKVYGDPGLSNRIFEANRDQLPEPDKLRPGQVLKIPALQ